MSDGSRTFETIQVEHDGACARLVINRPAVMNALSARTLDELETALVDLGRDEAVRVIVITGAGDKAFVAGADINELAKQTPDDCPRTGPSWPARLRSPREPRQTDNRRHQWFRARRRL